MAVKKLNRHVRFGGESYGPGDEDALNEAVESAAAAAKAAGDPVPELDEEALEARGVIGDVKSAAERRESTGQSARQRRATKKAAVKAGAKAGARKSKKAK